MKSDVILMKNRLLFGSVYPFVFIVPPRISSISLLQTLSKILPSFSFLPPALSSFIFIIERSERRNILDCILSLEVVTSRQIQIISSSICVKNNLYPKIVSPTFSSYFISILLIFSIISLLTNFRKPLK